VQSIYVFSAVKDLSVFGSVLLRLAVCLSVSQCVAVCHSVLQSVAVCCSSSSVISLLRCNKFKCVLQRVSATVLQCVAVVHLWSHLTHLTLISHSSHTHLTHLSLILLISGSFHSSHISDSSLSSLEEYEMSEMSMRWVRWVRDEWEIVRWVRWVWDEWDEGWVWDEFEMSVRWVRWVRDEWDEWEMSERLWDEWDEYEMSEMSDELRWVRDEWDEWGMSEMRDKCEMSVRWVRWVRDEWDDCEMSEMSVRWVWGECKMSKMSMRWVRWVWDEWDGWEMSEMIVRWVSMRKWVIQVMIVQGGEDLERFIFIDHFPQKSPICKKVLQIVALWRKETCSLKHDMNLCHPVCRERKVAHWATSGPICSGERWLEKAHRMPCLYRSFSAKDPCTQ